MIFEEEEVSHTTQYMSFSRYGRTLEKTQFQAAQKEVLLSTNIKHGQKYVVQPENNQTEKHSSAIVPLATPKHQPESRDKKKSHIGHVFKKVSREIKCFSRIPEFEEPFKGKYAPNFDFVKPCSPSVIIRSEQKPRAISMHPIQVDEKEKQYFVCLKDPLLKWGDTTPIQKSQTIANKEQEKEQSDKEKSEQQNNEEVKQKQEVACKTRPFNGIDLHKLEKTARSQINSPTFCKVWYDKMPKRILCDIPNRGNYEGNLMNFSLMKQKQDQIHEFTSYSGHEFKFKTASNCYDLLKVNYSRLVPEQNKTFLDFQKQIRCISTRQDRSPRDPLPSTILEYNLTQKATEKIPNFEKYMGRKKQYDPELRRTKTKTDPRVEKQITVYFDSPTKKAWQDTKTNFFND